MCFEIVKKYFRRKSETNIEKAVEKFVLENNSFTKPAS